MTGPEHTLRPWSSLSEDEQTALMIDYQPEIDKQPLTCDFASKLAHMQRWLETRGVTISEDDIRRPGKGSD